MNIISIDSLPSILDNISAKKVYTDSNVEIIQIELLPNQAIPVHKNDVSALFNIVSGNGVVTIENKTFNVKKGDFLKIEKGLDRAWENGKDSNLTIIVTKLLS